MIDSVGNALDSSEGYGGNLILWLKKRQGEQAMQLTNDERARLRAFDNDFNKAEPPAMDEEVEGELEMEEKREEQEKGEGVKEREEGEENGKET